MIGWGVPPDVGVIDNGDAVYLAPLPDGEIHVLAGSALVIFRIACEKSQRTVASRVAEVAGVPEESISNDVEIFLDTLVNAGLLWPVA